MRAAVLATCDACDGVVTIVTGDAYPQKRGDYGVALVVGLLGLFVVLVAIVAIVSCLAAFAYIVFATHTPTSCVVAGSILTVVMVMCAAGRLRRYVYERFEKGE